MPALGLQIAQRQTHAALKLEEALRAPDAARMWQLGLRSARLPGATGNRIRAGEYPPFDRWYHESWIRSAFSQNNPHRAYNQLRAFMASEGRGTPLRLPPVVR